ncbi:hypothetical protein DIPPA_14442 [Diplonema papillatum]|nr:hypothetical protein DIPPA_14442 [Diplonema papillatum]
MNTDNASNPAVIEIDVSNDEAILKKSHEVMSSLFRSLADGKHAEWCDAYTLDNITFILEDTDIVHELTGRRELKLYFEKLLSDGPWANLPSVSWTDMELQANNGDVTCYVSEVMKGQGNLKIVRRCYFLRLSSAGLCQVIGQRGMLGSDISRFVTCLTSVQKVACNPELPPLQGNDDTTGNDAAAPPLINSMPKTAYAGSMTQAETVDWIVKALTTLTTAMSDGFFAGWVNKRMSDDVVMEFRDSNGEGRSFRGKQAVCMIYDGLVENIWGTGTSISWEDMAYEVTAGKGVCCVRERLEGAQSSEVCSRIYSFVINPDNLLGVVSVLAMPGDDISRMIPQNIPSAQPSQQQTASCFDVQNRQPTMPSMPTAVRFPNVTGGWATQVAYVPQSVLQSSVVMFQAPSSQHIALRLPPSDTDVYPAATPVVHDPQVHVPNAHIPQAQHIQHMRLPSSSHVQVMHYIPSMTHHVHTLSAFPPTHKQHHSQVTPLAPPNAAGIPSDIQQHPLRSPTSTLSPQSGSNNNNNNTNNTNNNNNNNNNSNINNIINGSQFLSDGSGSSNGHNHKKNRISGCVAFNGNGSGSGNSSSGNGTHGKPPPTTVGKKKKNSHGTIKRERERAESSSSPWAAQGGIEHANSPSASGSPNCFERGFAMMHDMNYNYMSTSTQGLSSANDSSGTPVSSQTHNSSNNSGQHSSNGSTNSAERSDCDVADATAARKKATHAHQKHTYAARTSFEQKHASNSSYNGHANSSRACRKAANTYFNGAIGALSENPSSGPHIASMQSYSNVLAPLVAAWDDKAPPTEIAHSRAEVVPRSYSSASSNRESPQGRENSNVECPVPTFERPCQHNMWDSVRIKRKWCLLRCRLCESQWRLPASDIPIRRCNEFAAHGCKNMTCKALHIFLRKQRLEERFAVPAPSSY